MRDNEVLIEIVTLTGRLTNSASIAVTDYPLQSLPEKLAKKE